MQSITTIVAESDRPNVGLAQLEGNALGNVKLMPPKHSERLDWIDGLRAVACIAVILCHSTGYMPASWTLFSFSPWDRTYSISITNAWDYLGYTGVNLFLVLSGFCLNWPLTKVQSTDPTLVQFLWRRFKRLAPAYYVAAILAILWSLHKHEIDRAFAIRDVIVHLAFLQEAKPAYSVILGQSWSLVLEWQCYFLFPLFIIAMRKFGARPVVLFTLIANAAFRYWICNAIGFTGDRSQAFSLICSGAGRCSEFVIGMACATAIREWLVTGICPLRRTDAILLAVALAQIIWGIAVIWDNNNIARFAPFSDGAWGVLFGALLLVASRKDMPIRRWLSVRPLVWFGSISYSIYLVHVHVIMFVQRVLRMGDWGVLGTIVGQIVVLIPMCAALGYLFFIPFEKPFINHRSQSR